MCIDIVGEMDVLLLNSFHQLHQYISYNSSILAYPWAG